MYVHLFERTRGKEVEVTPKRQAAAERRRQKVSFFFSFIRLLLVRSYCSSMQYILHSIALSCLDWLTLLPELSCLSGQFFGRRNFLSCARASPIVERRLKLLGAREQLFLCDLSGMYLPDSFSSWERDFCICQHLNIRRVMMQ